MHNNEVHEHAQTVTVDNQKQALDPKVLVNCLGIIHSSNLQSVQHGGGRGEEGRGGERRGEEGRGGEGRGGEGMGGEWRRGEGRRGERGGEERGGEERREGRGGEGRGEEREGDINLTGWRQEHTVYNRPRDSRQDYTGMHLPPIQVGQVIFIFY